MRISSRSAAWRYLDRSSFTSDLSASLSIPVREDSVDVTKEPAQRHRRPYLRECRRLDGRTRLLASYVLRIYSAATALRLPVNGVAPNLTSSSASCLSSRRL